MLGIRLTRSRLFGALITLALCASVASLLLLYRKYSPQSSADMAAWVQGIGTIVALFVSIGAGAYAARMARQQQRDEWIQRRLDALEGTLARLRVVQTLTVSVHARLDEAIRSAIPAQPGALDLLDRCIELLMAEVQGATQSTAVDECSWLLGDLIELREVALRWGEPGRVGGGSRYDLLKAKRIATLCEVMGRIEQELQAQRSGAGVH